MALVMGTHFTITQGHHTTTEALETSLNKFFELKIFQFQCQCIFTRKTSYHIILPRSQSTVYPKYGHGSVFVKSL